MNEVCNFMPWKIVSWVKDTTYTAEAGFFPFCHIVSRQMLSEGWFAHVFFHRLKRRKQTYNWLPFCTLSDISRFPFHAEVNSPSDVWTLLIRMIYGQQMIRCHMGFKGTVDSKMKIRSSFIHPFVIYTPYAIVLWALIMPALKVSKDIIFNLEWTILLMWSHFFEACWESWHLVVLKVAL